MWLRSRAAAIAIELAQVAKTDALTCQADLTRQGFTAHLTTVGNGTYHHLQLQSPRQLGRTHQRSSSHRDPRPPDTTARTVPSTDPPGRPDSGPASDGTYNRKMRHPGGISTRGRELA